MSINHSAIAEMYDDYAEEYTEAIVSKAHTQLPRLITQFLEKNSINQADYAVLDVGCGPGNLKTYTYFASYSGVDISAAMLTKAGDAGYELLLEGPIEDVLYSLPDKSFDGVIAVSSLYFLPPEEMQQVLLHMDRLSRKFWVATLDQATPALQAVYKENADIDIYDHRGFPMREDIQRFRATGWYSDATGEEIEVECVGYFSA